MTATLQVANLEIGYKSGGKVNIVSGPLDAQLATGELVCIMGANGAGKSTFIRTVAGLQAPISGSVLISGTDINSISNQEKAKLLSVVLTGRTASQYMTVHELVELGRYPHTNWKNAINKADNSAIDRAIEAVGLANDRNRPVSELSDGNAQKAMIARALAQDTRIIILDEPTVHLDLRNKLMILQLLKDLSKQFNKSILIASHDLNMMIKVADKIWLFDHDKLITGIPEDLMLSGSIKTILGSEDFKPSTQFVQSQSSMAVTLTGDEASKYWLAQALTKNGYKVSDSSETLIEASKNGFTVNFKSEGNSFTSIEETLKALEDFIHE